MKTISIETEDRPVRKWLPKRKNSRDVIYLTQNGRPTFAIVPLDEGDQEVLAIRKNKKLMSVLDELSRRALAGPRKTLAEIKKKYGIK